MRKVSILFSRLFILFAWIAEFVVAIALATIFVTFLVQIFTRYAPNLVWLVPFSGISDWMLGIQPLGWTVNLISLLWVWVVLFGSSFVLRERDHVTFDVLYFAVSKKIRVVLSYISTLGLLFVMIYALPSTWDAVFDNRLMELKQIQTLRVPFTGEKIAIKWLFASIILFMVVTIIRYLWRLQNIVRKGVAEGHDYGGISAGSAEVVDK